MKKILIGLLAVILAACAPTHGKPQTPHTRAASALEELTIALVMSDEDGNTGAYCSGVWVDEHAFVTAYHCVADEELDARLTFVTRGDVLARRTDEVETLRLGRLVKTDPDHDLALVAVYLPPMHTVARLGAPPAVGDVVQTMGHPRGLWWSYSAGNVAAVRMLEDPCCTAMWWVQSTAPISPGNSGGGLFNDAGELVGIAHAYIPMRAENVNFYIDARYVRALLEDDKP